MPGPVEFWFDFASPYAYFAAETVEERLRPYGRPIEWRPFLLGVALVRTGMRPLALMPMRGDYARRDWDRLARITGRPFRLPEGEPMRSQALARAHYWMVEHHPDLAAAFARAAFRAHFAAGVDLAAPAAVVRLACGFVADTRPLADWLGSRAARDRLFASTEEAIGKGVHGAPWFIADGEPFWGFDRLPMLERWLSDGEWRTSP